MMTKEVFDARFFCDIDGIEEAAYIVADGARDLRREFGMSYRPARAKAARRGLRLAVENVLCLDGSVPRDQVETEFDRRYVDDLIDSLVEATLKSAEDSMTGRFCAGYWA